MKTLILLNDLIRGDSVPKFPKFQGTWIENLKIHDSLPKIWKISFSPVKEKKKEKEKEHTKKKFRIYFVSVIM